MKFFRFSKEPIRADYIVRLYRRVVGTDGASPHGDSVTLAGVIERIGDGKRASFRNIEELRRILAGVSPFTFPGISAERNRKDPE